jgi:hypothetical protein
LFCTALATIAFADDQTAVALTSSLSPISVTSSASLSPTASDLPVYAGK